MNNRSCVSFGNNNEPNTHERTQQSCWERRHSIAALHASLGRDRVALLENIGCLKEIEDSILPVLIDNGYDEQNALLPIGSWVDSVIQITLDSGCVEHVMCLEDAPGYDQ